MGPLRWWGGVQGHFGLFFILKLILKNSLCLIISFLQNKKSSFRSRDTYIWILGFIGLSIQTGNFKRDFWKFTKVEITLPQVVVLGLNFTQGQKIMCFRTWSDRFLIFWFFLKWRPFSRKFRENHDKNDRHFEKNQNIKNPSDQVLKHIIFCPWVKFQPKTTTWGRVIST
mgnify:CR=1 FL=1